jgi:hypothetical protein
MPVGGSGPDPGDSQDPDSWRQAPAHVERGSSPHVDAATAGWVVERWYRSAPAPDPCSGSTAAEQGPAYPGGIPELVSRLEVVAAPTLAAELSELLGPTWEVRAVATPGALSVSADAVVLDAPRAGRVAAVRRAAPHARLLATFAGPAPGPAREEALRAGVEVCVEGSSGPVVARYLGYLRGSVAEPHGGPEAPAPRRRPG